MRLLFVGLGNLGSQIFDLFALRAKAGDQVLIAGRNLDYLRERANWTASAALQLSTSIKVATTFMDVLNIDQTAQTISSFKPDMIFSSVSLLPSASISQLPPPLFDKLVKANGGPWLPTTLAPVHKLMRAVQQTGLKTIVLNGGTPDNSHEVLQKIGLAPASGFGNIALVIPPLKKAIAEYIQRPLEQIEILFFAHAYVVQSLRRGTVGGAPFHITISVNGEDVTAQLDLPSLFSDLPLTLEHEYTQLATAASAVGLLDMLTVGTPSVMHVPGPDGLPGGYPVRMSERGLEIVLPQGFTREEAIRINQEGQRLDGVERIDDDGTVHFVERNMAILKETLGYECLSMTLAEVEERAKELHVRFLALASKS